MPRTPPTPTGSAPSPEPTRDVPTGPAGILHGGTAGGHIGALVLSPFAKAGTTSDTPYNQYSLLATIEDTFSLPRLGYAAAPELKAFGTDVFAKP
jgi:hypothetical protein